MASKNVRLIKACELANHLGKTDKLLGYSICRKTTSTKQHELMGFDAWYDVAGNYFNSVIFPGEMKQYAVAVPFVSTHDSYIWQESGDCSYVS